MAQGRKAEWQEGRRSFLRLSVSALLPSCPPAFLPSGVSALLPCCLAAFLTFCLAALPASVSAQEPRLSTVLEPLNQARFSFKRTNHQSLDTFTRRDAPTAAFRSSTEVWIVEYEERQTGTIIRNRERKDVPSRGRFWIEAATGRVLMSELVARDREVRGTIDVSYQSEPLVGLLVPIEMREEYRGPAGSRITGVATYGQFRQFQVQVDEKFAPIKER